MFIKNLITLFSGTLLAQVIPLLIAPVLTRLYTPSDFGIYGVFLAIIGFSSVIATFRYDFALAQADSNRDSQVLLFLTALISGLVSGFILVLGIINGYFYQLTEAIPPVYFFLIALSTFLMGITQSITYFANRSSKFGLVAKLKVIQALVGCVSMLLLPNYTISGLVAGHIIGQLVFLLFFLIVISSLEITRKEIILAAKKYSVYPKTSLPGAIFNSGFLQIPIVFINAKFAPLYVGYFSFVNRYISGPLGILSVAISQVLMKEVAINPSNLLKLFYRLVLVNSAIGIVFISILHLYGKNMISLIFGTNWVGVYPIVIILSYSIAIRFVVSSVSVILTKKENIHLAVQWQVGSFIALCLFLSLSSEELTFISFLEQFVILDIGLYLVYLYQIRKGLVQREG